LDWWWRWSRRISYIFSRRNKIISLDSGTYPITVGAGGTSGQPSDKMQLKEVQIQFFNNYISGWRWRRIRKFQCFFRFQLMEDQEVEVEERFSRLT
jgi:hypothetical protein